MKHLKGSKIFTPTLGWSSYLYGFFESSYVKEYVGTDVINDVCKKRKNFPKITIKCTIYCKPSKITQLESFSKNIKTISMLYFSVLLIMNWNYMIAKIKALVHISHMKNGWKILGKNNTICRMYYKKMVNCVIYYQVMVKIYNMIW